MFKYEFSKFGIPELTTIMCGIDNVVFNTYLSDTVFSIEREVVIQ